jgi:hypothetical protein
MLVRVGLTEMVRKNFEAPLVQRRKMLLVGLEPSLQGLISTFLITMGWTYSVVQDVKDAPGIVEREAFDALLIDLGRSESDAEQAILGIKQIRPSLEGRILVIGEGAVDRKMTELIERHDLIQVSPLQQIWDTLENLYAEPRPSELPRRRMPIARMIFDSFRNPLPAGGIRSLIVGTRQLAYLHEETMIDLSIEPAQEAKRVSLAGQVLDAKGKYKNEDLSVLLVSGAGTLVRTVTNEFGEFHMEIDSPQEANLEIRLGEQSWVMVPVGRLDTIGKSFSSKELTSESEESDR